MVQNCLRLQARGQITACVHAGNLGLLAEGKINKKIHAQDVDLSACIHTCSSAALHAGHADVKAIIDQEIAQEIARLEAKIDAVISKLMLDSEFASTQCLDRSRCQAI